MHFLTWYGAQHECCTAWANQSADDTAVATRKYVDVSCRLLQAMNARVSTLVADVSKPVFEPLVPSHEVVKFLSSDTAMTVMTSFGVDHAELHRTVSCLMVQPR